MAKCQICMPQEVRLSLIAFAAAGVALVAYLSFFGPEPRMVALAGSFFLSAVAIAFGLRWPAVVVFSTLAGYIFNFGFLYGGDVGADWGRVAVLSASLMALSMAGLFSKAAGTWFAAKNADARMHRMVFAALAYCVALAAQNIVLEQDWSSPGTAIPALVSPLIALIFGPFLLVVEMCHGWTDDAPYWLVGMLGPYAAYCGFVCAASKRTSLWRHFGRRHEAARLAFCAVMAIVAAMAIWFEVPEVELHTIEVAGNKVGDGGVRLAVISDLHSCSYGRYQADIRRKLTELHSDKPINALVYAGDIIDDRLPDEPALALCCIDDWPVYFVTGNHDFWTEKVYAYKHMLRHLGVHVLDGNGETLQCKDCAIDICGVDDPTYILEDAWREQLSSAAAAHVPSRLGILVSHRPEMPEEYEGRGFDIVISGHMHGGQWLIPFWHRGVIASGCSSENVGRFFPLHTHGVETLADGTRLAISRGIAREAVPVPRFFNHPSIMVLDIFNKPCNASSL